MDDSIGDQHEGLPAELTEMEKSVLGCFLDEDLLRKGTDDPKFKSLMAEFKDSLQKPL